MFWGLQYGSRGGYPDGRWQSGVKAIITHSNLSAGDWVLDVGFVKEF